MTGSGATGKHRTPPNAPQSSMRPVARSMRHSAHTDNRYHVGHTEAIKRKTEKLEEKRHRRTPQPIQGVTGGKRRFQAHRAVKHKRRPGPQLERNGIIKKRKFDDQIIGRTMKPCFVELIGRSIIQPKMRILVMRDQGVNRQLGRSRQRKKRQQPAC